MVGHYGWDGVEFYTAQKVDSASVFYQNNAVISPRENPRAIVAYCETSYYPCDSSIPEIGVNKLAFKIFPNPANGMTTISFELPQLTDVKVRITDLQGKIMDQKSYSALNPGEHNLQISTENFDSGIYLVILETENQQQTERLIITK